MADEQHPGRSENKLGCKICEREDIYDVNVMLLTGSVRSTAAHFGEAETTMRRHYHDCIPNEYKDALRNTRMKAARTNDLRLADFISERIDDELRDLEYLRGQLKAIEQGGEVLSPKEYFEARKKNVDSMHKWVAMEGKRTGELSDSHNVTVSHDAINETLVAALDDIDSDRGLEPGTTIRAVLAKLNGEGATPVLGSGEEGE